MDGEAKMDENKLYIESLEIDGKRCEDIVIEDNADMIAIDYAPMSYNQYDRPYRIHSRERSRRNSKSGKTAKKRGSSPLISQIVICAVIISAALIFRYADIDSFNYLREQYQYAMSQQMDFSDYGSALLVFMQNGADEGSQSPSSEDAVGQQPQASHPQTNEALQLALPVEDAVVTSHFGEQRTNEQGESQTHKGIDLAVALGSPITPVMSGKVITAKQSDSYGNYVVIEHENGLQSLYAHCSSIQCEVGQKVDELNVIAFAGATGNATGPHLHLEIKKDGQCVDPMQYYAADAFAQSNSSAAKE